VSDNARPPRPSENTHAGCSSASFKVSGAYSRTCWNSRGYSSLSSQGFVDLLSHYEWHCENDCNLGMTDQQLSESRSGDTVQRSVLTWSDLKTELLLLLYNSRDTHLPGQSYKNPRLW
jgi:hypothetical protein